MKKSIFILLLVVALIATSCMNSITKDENENNNIKKYYSIKNVIQEKLNVLDSTEYFENQLNIGYQNEEALNKVVKILKADEIKKIDEIKVATVKLNYSVKKALEVLIKQDLKNINFVEPNYKRNLTPYTVSQIKDALTKSPTIRGSQWALELLNAKEAWKVSTGKDVVVAIMDGGSDSRHPDLKGQYVTGLDAFNKKLIPANTSIPYGDHGTHVSGIVAGKFNENGEDGIEGLAPEAKLMPIPVFAPDFIGDNLIAMSTIWAVNNGAKVLQNSWGGPGYSDTLKLCFDYALINNAVVVVSTGNTHIEENYGSPNSLPGIIGVGASMPDDNITEFSTRGDSVSVVAPGYQIMSSIAVDSKNLNPYYGEYTFMNGTSMAAPYVSALAALIFEKYPDATSYQVRKIIEDSAKDLYEKGWDADSGYGRIDPVKALNTKLPLNKGANLSIKVTDSSGTDVLSGVYVTLLRYNKPSYYARTDSSGICNFLQIDPDVYDIVIGGPDLLDINTVINRQCEQNSITIKSIEIPDGEKVLEYKMKTDIDITLEKPKAEGNYKFKLLDRNKDLISEQDFNKTIKLSKVPTTVFYLSVESDTLPELEAVKSDNFESNDFKNWNWELSENSPIIIEDEGNKVVKFADITHEESSSFSTSTTLEDSTYGYLLNFDYRVSSELDFDFFKVKVNNEILFKSSGDTGWKNASIKISQGINEIEFIYEKDSLEDGNDDTAWVDNIKIEKLPENYTDYNVNATVKINGKTFEITHSLFGSSIIDEDPRNDLFFTAF